jgi:hypothetical protein
MVEFMQQGTTITLAVYCAKLKKKNCIRPFRTKGMHCSSTTMCVCKQLPALEHCWRISTGSSVTTLLTALTSLRATTTCLPTWRTVWDHSPSTITSWWKLTGGRGLWHSHTKNLLPDTSASILAVIMLRSRLSMYIFFIYNNFFPSLLVLLTAHQRLLSE